MKILKGIPATIGLIVSNVVTFVMTYVHAGTFDNPEWTTALLELGAEFNPYTLDGQWYRVFSHMFLHGHVFHLLLNMYALFAVGRELELAVGTKKYLWIYVLSGMGASMASLYWNMFAIGVGASGAIFGIFGFSLVRSLMDRHSEERSVFGVLLNFAVFMAINLIFAEAFHADTAAHLGGLGVGIILGVGSFLFHRRPAHLGIEYILLPVLILVFSLLPSDQVAYFKFFEKVLHAENVARELAPEKRMSNEDYLTVIELNKLHWDTASMMLNGLAHVPEKLNQDTFKLRRYIQLRKLEYDYKANIIRDESYIFMDSIEHVQDSMQHFINLDYALVMKPEKRPKVAIAEKPAQDLIQVWYDMDWIETSPPGKYYRIGFRDSLNRWQGMVRDYYADGNIQMKGVYKDDQRDGIFLYYTRHKTYTSAGRYVANMSEGKWQNFHRNGRLNSEIIYNGPTRLKNLWDSTGVQLVKDGYGTIAEYSTNGVVTLEGEYIDGLKEGPWLGRYENGEMHFKEEFAAGVLVRGRSRNKRGETFVYDQSVFYPRPEGGYPKLKAWLDREASFVNSTQRVTLKVSFRVTADGKLADFEPGENSHPVLVERVEEMLRRGPKWLPAKQHGYIPIDGFAMVEVDF